MFICYIDESGNVTQPLPVVPGPNDQPVFVLSALFIDAARLERLTNDFLGLKHRFFPGLAYRSTNHLDRILAEVKGTDLRRDSLRPGISRNDRRAAYGFLDKTLTLLEQHQVRLVSRIWVKGLGQPFNAVSIYTSSTQSIYDYYEHFLSEQNDFGFCIADSRNHQVNVGVSHSIFTRKFQASTSFYSRVLELPTFSHSDNHAGLQLCDIVSSALLYPIACEAYCTGYVSNVHVQPAATQLKARFGERIKRLSYRFQEPGPGGPGSPGGRFKGGLVVSDAIANRSSSLMF